MPCNQSQLNALADGELGIWAAARLRRHLRTCPACADEYEAIRNLGIQMQTWCDVKAPAGLEARITSVLPQARTETAQKRLAWRPLAAVAVAAVVFAAIALFMPGQPGRPAPAIADVERAMQNVQNISWQWDDYWKQGRTTKISHRLCWVRMSPPASTDYIADFDEWELSDAHGYVDYSPKHNTYIKHPLQQYTQKDAQDMIRRFTEPFAAENDIKPSANTHWTPWRRERVILGGRSCWRFSREERRNTASNGIEKKHLVLPPRGLYRMMLWADAGTLRVYRIEFHTSGSSYRGPYQTVFSNFRYNQTPPKGVFDWSPPPGAKEFKPAAHVAPKSGAAKPPRR